MGRPWSRLKPRNILPAPETRRVWSWPFACYYLSTHKTSCRKESYLSFTHEKTRATAYRWVQTMYLKLFHNGSHKYLITISNHLPNHVGRPGGTHRNALNTPEPKQNGRHFADIISIFILWYENHGIFMHISINLFPGLLINNQQSLVQIVAWRLAAAHHRLWDSIWGVDCSDTECHNLLTNMSRHPDITNYHPRYMECIHGRVYLCLLTSRRCFRLQTFFANNGLDWLSLQRLVLGSHHWSQQQLRMHPMTKISSKWRYFRSSESHGQSRYLLLFRSHHPRIKTVW